MFSLPTPEGVSLDGYRDKQPLFLEGVRRKDFRLLLKAMKFPAKFQESALETENSFTSGTYCLELSHGANVDLEIVKKSSSTLMTQ